MKKSLGVAVLTFLWAAVLAQDATVEAPVDLSMKEQVEVRLVLIDVLVLDRGDRTVPDLAKEDFELHVDGKTVAIETLDTRCPEGAADEARPVKHPGRSPEATAAPGTGRMVLVFDYFHMTSGRGGLTLDGVTAFGAAADALRSGRFGGDEIMVVSLGEVMRIEAPFTSDRDEVLRTLERMERDPEVFGGPRGLTEFRFFRRLRALMDLMEMQPGRKALVLFSGPIDSDGFTHDPDYARLSAMAATSRTAIYPVDTGGLRAPLDPDNQPLGGPPMLRRLASETGGRMTSDTNDLALGPARAARDLGCTYTLGFHDREGRLDRSRRVSVLVPERRGIRAVYPDRYVVRSPEEAAESRLETASMAPASFLSDDVRIDLEIGRAVSETKREATLRIEFDPKLLRRDGEPFRLRAFVRKPSGAVVHRIERRISAPPGTIREAMRLRAGRYVLSAVLSDPEGGLPLASVREVVVP